MPRGLAKKTIEMRNRAYAILEERHPAPVRHVCYQLFNVHRLIPDMSKKSTDKVSGILTRAREEGIIPWAWIVDDTRAVERRPAWSDPVGFFESVARQYRADRWADQPNRVMVISEKSTVSGMLRPVLRRWAVPFASFHGHSSATALNDLAGESIADDRPLTILYVGDHDPSGRHMSDVDIPGRLTRYGGSATLVRLAVTPQQIAAEGLPTFSAEEKEKDARHRWFVETHGDECCELDTVNPNVLRDLVGDAIRPLVDKTAWDRAEAVERVERASIQSYLADYPGAA